MKNANLIDLNSDPTVALNLFYNGHPVIVMTEWPDGHRREILATPGDNLGWIIFLTKQRRPKAIHARLASPKEVRSWPANKEKIIPPGAPAWAGEQDEDSGKTWDDDSSGTW